MKYSQNCGTEEGIVNDHTAGATSVRMGRRLGAREGTVTVTQGSPCNAQALVLNGKPRE